MAESFRKATRVYAIFVRLNYGRFARFTELITNRTHNDCWVFTLRTTNSFIWLLSLGEGEQAPTVSRLLRPEERAALQGFKFADLPPLRPAQAVHVFGNTMAVPVVGQVLLSVFHASQATTWGGPRKRLRENMSDADWGARVKENKKRVESRRPPRASRIRKPRKKKSDALAAL